MFIANTFIQKRTPTSVGASDQPGQTLGAFLELFALLEDREGYSPRSYLERLENLTLEAQPLLVVCL